jgi:hypothetical protein
VSEHEADFTAYDAMFGPQPEDPAYLAWLEARLCPLHGPTRVAEADAVPSMLGSGWEDWERQECGCTLTWDPFTGREHWTPRP